LASNLALLLLKQVLTKAAPVGRSTEHPRTPTACGGLIRGRRHQGCPLLSTRNRPSSGESTCQL